MSQEESKKRNKGGRPRKGEEPRVPYNKLDDLLVKGEIVKSKDGAGTKVVYPTYVELSRRFGVSRSTISDFSTKRNCRRRRMELQSSIKVKPEHKLSDYKDQDIDFDRTDVLRIIRKWLMRFEEAVEEGSVRFDNPADLNTLARLQEFLSGHAESRKEIHNSLTLEQIQERHMAQLKIIENTTPGERGEVVERVIEGTVERTAGGMDCGRLPPAKPSEEPFLKEAIRYQNTCIQPQVKHLKESNRYQNATLSPHCGSEIIVEDVDEAEDKCTDGNVEVIETDPRCDLDDNFDEITSQTHQKPKQYENIDELTDLANEPEVESEEFEDADFESIVTTIESTDNTKTDPADTNTEPAGMASKTTDTTIESIDNTNTELADTKTDPAGMASKLTVATVDPTTATIELTDTPVELPATTFEQANSSNKRPNTHPDDGDSDSPKSQPTDNPNPELPLLNNSGNSRKAHDNDSE